MDIRRALNATGRNIRNHGYSAAAYDLTVRLTNRLITYRRLQCLVVEQPDPSYLILPSPFRCIRLQAADLQRFALLPEYELDAEFLQDAGRKGDECFAVFQGDSLASYSWYSREPTRINHALELQFDGRYRYMYKGFTLHSFRGHRLYPTGVTIALNAYRSEGYKGLLAYVEAQNFDSLKSCYRMGYRPCGHIRYFKIGKKYKVLAHSACRQYSLRLYQVDAARTAKNSRIARAS